jgi:hypothetical protein
MRASVLQMRSDSKNLIELEYPKIVEGLPLRGGDLDKQDREIWKSMES